MASPGSIEHCRALSRRCSERSSSTPSTWHVHQTIQANSRRSTLPVGWCGFMRRYTRQTKQERDMSWAVSIAHVSRFTRYNGIDTKQIDGHPVLIDNIYHRVSSDGRSLCLEIGVIPRDVVTFEALVEPREHRATIRPFRRLQNWTRAHSVPMQFSSASRLEIDSLWKPTGGFYRQRRR